MAGTLTSATRVRQARPVIFQDDGKDQTAAPRNVAIPLAPTISRTPSLPVPDRTGRLLRQMFSASNLGKFSAGFDDACHQPLLRFIVACARQSVDFPDQWVIVENKRHFITGDHHQMRRDGQGQIQKMRIRQKIMRTISPDPHSNLHIFQFDAAL